jgi:hypothetical protein
MSAVAAASAPVSRVRLNDDKPTIVGVLRVRSHHMALPLYR